MSEPDPHLYHLNKPEKSGRAWVYVIVIFCAALVLGSVWYVLARMPDVLAGNILTARRVDITSTATKTPLVLTAQTHRDALAKLFDTHDFKFSPSDTWKAYKGEIPRDPNKETMVFEIVSSDNRTTPVEVLGGDLMLSGKFAFRAAKPGDFGPDVVNITKLKK